MSAAKRGLGRGFDSLIPIENLDESFDTTAKEEAKVSEGDVLALSKLHANPEQPRRHFDEEGIAELSGSIKEHGVLQPLIVTPDGDGYRIVAGERRFRAATKAGLGEVPVVIRTMSGQHELEVSLIENIQRRDLNTIETAMAYAKLRDQFNMTSEQIAERVHKSPSAVINTMRLLKLPTEAIVALAEGRLREGQARPLVGQPEEVILSVLPKIIEESWSARKVEQYVANLKSAARTPGTPRAELHTGEAEAFSSRFNTKVAVQTNARGAGKIVISFSDDKEFDRIKKMLG